MMRKRPVSEFWRDEGAAIAPLYALALFGLVGIAGVGWDYGRLMAMDSELQNAADQAALAAATQLDHGDDAITRAKAAANDYLASSTSDWTNETRMANDGAGRPITALTFRFYDSYDSATDTFGNEITDDTLGADAAVVQVIVDGREAFFALTPIVGAISSGDIVADAVAGVHTATCNVPPLMFCMPSGDSLFPGTDDIGKGVAMHWHEGGNAAWAPGNFGFLNIDYPNVDPNDGNHLTGLNSDFLGCASDVVESRTGNRTPEMRALNTRFDIYENGGGVNCDTSNGDFCPSEVSQKNWVVAESFNNSSTHPDAMSCSTSPNNPSWVEASTTGEAVDPATDVGFPKDTSNGTDGFGNGSWDFDSFMTANHPASTLGTGADLDNNGAISRYEVYMWEIANPSELLPNGTKVGASYSQNQNGNYSGQLYCAHPSPFDETPWVPGTNQKDRRVITVAAVDCTGLNGQAPVNIVRWVDLFLVQPADASSSDQSFYSEVIGEADPPGANQSAFQAYGKNKPVLLR